jgi:hypothetical protein
MNHTSLPWILVRSEVCLSHQGSLDHYQGSLLYCRFTAVLPVRCCTAGSLLYCRFAAVLPVRWCTAGSGARGHASAPQCMTAQHTLPAPTPPQQPPPYRSLKTEMLPTQNITQTITQSLDEWLSHATQAAFSAFYFDIRLSNNFLRLDDIRNIVWMSGDACSW